MINKTTTSIGRAEPARIPYADLKILSIVFEIPITTLQKWAVALNRQGHMSMLKTAYEAIDGFQDYTKLLSSERSVTEVATELGFDNPLTLNIDGVSNRTFRSWFDESDKQFLLKGFLIGLHWSLLKQAAQSGRFDSQTSLINLLKQKGIKTGEFIRVYQFQPETLSKLIAL